MKFKRSLLFTAAVFALFLYCCKKDKTKRSSTYEIIAEAKSWFSTAHKNYTPNWQKAVSISKNNLTYIFLPSNYKLNADTNRIISRLVIMDSAGIYSAKLIEFVNSNVPENLNNIIAIYHGDQNLKKLDDQYSGKVLILNADHIFLNGWQFVDGGFKHNLKLNSLKEDESMLKKKILMTLQPDPGASVCTDWYFTTWDANTGVVYSSIFLYNSCEIMGNGSASTSPTVQDSINVLAKQFCDGLSDQQMQTINNTLNEYNTYNCATKYLSTYFKTSSTQFKFCIENVSGNAQYHPGQNSISFSTNYAASRVDILEHEFYHAYQDKLYPGGTQQYGRVNGVAQAGFVNIEFEQAVITDIMHGGTTAFDTYGSPEQRERYERWINELTNTQTSFPKFKANGTASEVATYNAFITKYNSFLNEFNAMPNNPYHSLLINLTPNAIINLFNNIPLTCN